MAFNRTLEISKVNTTRFSRKRKNETEECYNEDFFNVISAIFWKCTLTDDETGLSEEVVGTSHLQYPEEDFIPFENVTKSQIMSWMESHEDVEYKVNKYLIPRLESKIRDSQKQVTTSTFSFDSLPD